MSDPLLQAALDTFIAATGHAPSDAETMLSKLRELGFEIVPTYVAAMQGSMIDRYRPQAVDVSVCREGDGSDSLWVNIDGRCVTRVKGIAPDTLILEVDGRHPSRLIQRSERSEEKPSGNADERPYHRFGHRRD